MENAVQSEEACNLVVMMIKQVHYGVLPLCIGLTIYTTLPDI